MKIHSLYNNPVHAGLDGFEPSKTQQHFVDEVDINKIIERAAHTGVAHQNQKQPMYGDYSQQMSFQEALMAMNYAESQFAKLDAKIRRRFDNNPVMMVNFVSDEKNREEAIELGLIGGLVMPDQRADQTVQEDINEAKKAPKDRKKEAKETQSDN